MHQLKKKRLLLIGDGPQKEELLEIKRMLQLDNVEFLGHLAAEQFRSVINGAKFNVIPSEWYENFPLSILECMAVGNPTIGARIGGIPELIEEGVNGVLFESGNVDDLAEKINFMLADSQRLQMMGRESRKKAEETYSAETHYQEMMKIYEQVLP